MTMMVVLVAFFLHAWILEGRLEDSFLAYPPPPFKWRSVPAHKFHSLGQDQSTVAQRTEMIVTECFLMSCRWVCFP